MQLEEMEKERIEELGTSLSAKPGQDVHIGGSVRHSSTSKNRGHSTTDLQVSSSLSKLASSSLTDLREQSYEGESQQGVINESDLLCTYTQWKVLYISLITLYYMLLHGRLMKLSIVYMCIMLHCML